MCGRHVIDVKLQLRIITEPRQWLFGTRAPWTINGSCHDKRWSASFVSRSVHKTSFRSIAEARYQAGIESRATRAGESAMESELDEDLIVRAVEFNRGLGSNIDIHKLGKSTPTLCKILSTNLP